MADPLMTHGARLLKAAIERASDPETHKMLQQVVLLNGGFCEPGWPENEMHIALAPYPTWAGGSAQDDNPIFNSLSSDLIGLGFILVSNESWIECDRCFGVFHASGEVVNNVSICYKCMRSSGKPFITDTTPRQFLKDA